MNTPTGKNKKRIAWIIPAAGGLLLLVLILLVYGFFHYRSSGGGRPTTSLTQVIISQPGNLAQFPAGLSIEVTVISEGTIPLTGTELWVNGVLKGVQAGPSAGVTSLITQYDWLPTEGGAFSLISRAFDQKGNITTSPAVIVFISPPEQSELPDSEAGKVYPAVLPATPEGYIPPQAPADQGDISPASPWQGNPLDWITSLTTKSAPAAPELAASVEGCLVTLDIHDRSDNEEGFSLYRLTTDSPDWVHAADFASHAGQAWIEYQESGLTGGITYYVVAFNSQGQSSSNLALVNLDPQACQPPPPTTSMSLLLLGLENLRMADSSSNFYCYRRLGAGNWTRWPEVGFIGIEPSPFMEQPLLIGGLDGSGAQPIFPSFDLALDCWDWKAGKLRSLGSQLVNIDPGNLQKIHLPFGELEFDINPVLQTGIDNKLLTLEASNSYFDNLSLSPYDVDALGYVPMSDQMPEITAWTTDDPNVCRAAIDGELEKESNCFPMPGFNEGPGGINPQMYLIWSVDDSTCAGAPGKECHTLNWWKTFAEVNKDPLHNGIQFMVRSLAYDPENGVEMIDLPFALGQMAARISPNFPDVGGGNQCWNGNKFFQVYLDVHSSAGEITGYPSNLAAAPCPASIGDTVKIEVKWNWFSLDNIDDGLYTDLSEDHTAEVSGYFRSWTLHSDPASFLHIGWGNTFQGAWDGVNEYYELDAGTYDLAGFPLCNLFNLNDCFANFFLQNNNIVVVDLQENETLRLDARLRDYDESSNYDTLCNHAIFIGPYSFDDWAKMNNQTYYLGGEFEDASCTVEVTLNAVK